MGVGNVRLFELAGSRTKARRKIRRVRRKTERLKESFVLHTVCWLNTHLQSNRQY